MRSQPADESIACLRRPLSWLVYDVRRFYQDDTESIPAPSILSAGRLSLAGLQKRHFPSVSIDNDCI